MHVAVCAQCVAVSNWFLPWSGSMACDWYSAGRTLSRGDVEGKGHSGGKRFGETDIYKYTYTYTNKYIYKCTQFGFSPSWLYSGGRQETGRADSEWQHNEHRSSVDSPSASFLPQASDAHISVMVPTSKQISLRLEWKGGRILWCFCSFFLSCDRAALP